MDVEDSWRRASLCFLARFGLFGSFRLIGAVERRGKRPLEYRGKIEKLSRAPQVHSGLAAEELLDNTILSLFLTIAEINWNN